MKCTYSPACSCNKCRDAVSQIKDSYSDLPQETENEPRCFCCYKLLLTTNHNSEWICVSCEKKRNDITTYPGLMA